MSCGGCARRRAAMRMFVSRWMATHREADPFMACPNCGAKVLRVVGASCPHCKAPIATMPPRPGPNGP